MLKMENMNACKEISHSTEGPKGAKVSRTIKGKREKPFTRKKPGVSNGVTMYINVMSKELQSKDVPRVLDVINIESPSVLSGNRNAGVAVEALTLLASVSSTAVATPVDRLTLLSASTPPEDAMDAVWALVRGKRPPHEVVVKVRNDDVSQEDMSSLDGPHLPHAK